MKRMQMKRMQMKRMQMKRMPMRMLQILHPRRIPREMGTKPTRKVRAACLPRPTNTHPLSLSIHIV